MESQRYVNYDRFQSTPSLRRATQGQGEPKAGVAVSIHALLAESDGISRLAYILHAVSIHALLAESDLSIMERSHGLWVSIHALLAESDCLNGTCC